MISPAKRLDAVQEYYFAAKLKDIAARKAAGRNVLNLGIGSPDLPPSEDVVEALQRHASQSNSHGYQPYSGLAELRTAWTKWYDRHYDVHLNPESEVLPLIGSKEGILHIAMSFLESGDIALVPNPGYPSYRAASLLAGAEVLDYNLHEAGNWQPNLEELERSDLSRVKIMWVNYPHMPSGTPANQGLFQKLVDFGRRNKILIVHDNPYSFILNENPESILSAVGAMDVALELNSLSKSHNMAGWRMGVLCGQEKYLKTVLRFKSNLDSGQFRPMQMAAVQALSSETPWFQDLNTLYHSRQQIAIRILESIGCSVGPSQQGMFVWARIPENWQNAFALSDHLLDQYDLFLTPGGIFGSNGNQYLRISLCSDTSILTQALERLEQKPVFS